MDIFLIEVTDNHISLLNIQHLECAKLQLFNTYFKIDIYIYICICSNTFIHNRILEVVTYYYRQSYF